MSIMNNFIITYIKILLLLFDIGSAFQDLWSAQTALQYIWSVRLNIWTLNTFSQLVRPYKVAKNVSMTSCLTHVSKREFSKSSWWGCVLFTGDALAQPPIPRLLPDRKLLSRHYCRYPVRCYWLHWFLMGKFVGPYHERAENVSNHTHV